MKYKQLPEWTAKDSASDQSGALRIFRGICNAD